MSNKQIHQQIEATRRAALELVAALEITDMEISTGEQVTSDRDLANIEVTTHAVLCESLRVQALLVKAAA